MDQGFSASQDRETIAYHFRRSFETWHGVVMSTRKDCRAVADGINKLLADSSSERHMRARVDNDLVYAAGHYNKDLLDKIRAYARDNASRTVILQGRYQDFLGTGWLDDARKNYDF